jgi:hypothetical protein
LSSGGNVSQLGAGRVISQTEIAAVFLPAARSRNGLLAMGRLRAASSAAATFANREADRLSITSYRGPSGKLTSNPSWPNANRICISLFYRPEKFVGSNTAPRINTRRPCRRCGAYPGRRKSLRSWDLLLCIRHRSNNDPLRPRLGWCNPWP